MTAPPASRSKPTGHLKGKTALVTGGGTGIGAAIALAIAREGGDIWIAGRRRDHLDAIAHEATSYGIVARVIELDLADTDAVERIGAEVAASPAHLDILVHNAAMFGQSLVENQSLAGLEAIYRTNVAAPFALTKALLPMLRRSQGEIILVNSSSGHTAKPTTSAYDASKHALKAFADSLRAEVNAQGIRVLSLYLGRTASEMQRALHALEGKPYRPEVLIQPADVAAVVLAAIALPRSAEVTDIHMRPMQKS